MPSGAACRRLHRCWRKPAAGSAGATVHVDANVGGLVARRSRTVRRSLRFAARRAAFHSFVARWGDGARARYRRAIAARVPRQRRPKRRRGQRPSGWIKRCAPTRRCDATVMIPHPNDELGSTYGVHVESGAATADTRVVVPTARAAIRVSARSRGADVGYAARLRRV